MATNLFEPLPALSAPRRETSKESSMACLIQKPLTLKSMQLVDVWLKKISQIFDAEIVVGVG
jgi:hypothetical protein